MAIVAVHSERGAGFGPNQDGACAMVAQTPRGCVSLVAVCDGVGGLDAGELASATVIRRLVSWFSEELPQRMEEASADESPWFATVEGDWRQLIAQANFDLRAYGKQFGCVLGTTFSGVLCMGGRFLAGHVGDCRILQVGCSGVTQISEDQTLLALKLSTGQISSVREACPGDAHTILQAIGAQSSVRPRFYRGKLAVGDRLVLCCDGAWRRLGNEHIATVFRRVGSCAEEELRDACKAVASQAMDRGETDNITIGCWADDEHDSCGDDAS